MKIVLATGIYPPQIGGPATYVEQVGKELIRREQEVTVITYDRQTTGIEKTEEGGRVIIRVSNKGGPVLRYLRYRNALRQYAEGSDAVIAFSSISVGIPLKMAKLKSPQRFLRLGGDYFWERYTGMGGQKTLREWYRLKRPERPLGGFDQLIEKLSWSLNRWFLEPLLPKFHHIVFSTHFEEDIYRLYYRDLPPHSVIQNAFPQSEVSEDSPHVDIPVDQLNRQFRLLYFGRLVGFKNLPNLLRALARLPHARLALVGEGPAAKSLKGLVQKLGILDRVSFLSPKTGSEKKALFADHDLLILPSLTEISPNSALEARALALPVLLSEETGLSDELTAGMIIKPLRTPDDIARAVLQAEQDYQAMAEAAKESIPERSWEQVGEEWLALIKGMQESIQEAKEGKEE